MNCKQIVKSFVLGLGEFSSQEFFPILAFSHLCSDFSQLPWIPEVETLTILGSSGEFATSWHRGNRHCRKWDERTSLVWTVWPGRRLLGLLLKRSWAQSTTRPELSPPCLGEIQCEKIFDLEKNTRRYFLDFSTWAMRSCRLIFGGRLGAWRKFWPDHWFQLSVPLSILQGVSHAQSISALVHRCHPWVSHQWGRCVFKSS